MEENYTKRVLENLLNSSSSIISRYDLSLKLGAISLLLDFQNVEKHIEDTIKNIESLTPFDGILMLTCCILQMNLKKYLSIKNLILKQIQIWLSLGI